MSSSEEVVNVEPIDAPKVETVDADVKRKRVMPELIRLRNERRLEQIRKDKEEAETREQRMIERRKLAEDLRRQQIRDYGRNLLQRTMIPEHILEEEAKKEEKQRKQMRKRVESDSESESESESEYESETESESESQSVQPMSVKGFSFWKDKDGYLWERKGAKGVGDFAGKYIPRVNKIDDSMEEPYKLSLT